MKKLLIIALATFVLTSCSKDEKAETNITVSNQSQLTQTVYADDNTGSSDVSFTTNGAWSTTITESPTARVSPKSTTDWISISPSSGDKAGNYTLKISLDTNLTGETRSAVITILCNGDKITITITQEALTNEGKEPEPAPSDGRVKTINNKRITYSDYGVFSSIADTPYINKNYSSTVWAYLTDNTPGNYVGYHCYFNYGNNGLVDNAQYYFYRKLNNDPFIIKYQWSGNKLTAILGSNYNEVEANGMRQDIEYGDIEYTKGNVDINWLVANNESRGNNCFMTPWVSAIGVKSIPYNKLISKIVLTDLNDDKYSSTYTFTYDFDSNGYVIRIHEKYSYKLQGENGERVKYEFTY